MLTNCIAGRTKVQQLYLVLAGEKDVVRTYVSMNESCIMHFSQGIHDGCHCLYCHVKGNLLTRLTLEVFFHGPGIVLRPWLPLKTSPHLLKTLHWHYRCMG